MLITVQRFAIGTEPVLHMQDFGLPAYKLVTIYMCTEFQFLITCGRTLKCRRD